MTKLLIAVKSCIRDRSLGAHDVILDTWGQDVRDADLRFFMGDMLPDRGTMIQLGPNDETVHCLDDYENLPYKTREILRWSLFFDYDYTFLCDTDTFLFAKGLMSCGFQNYDIAARFGTIHPVGSPRFDYNDGRGNQGLVYPWPSGGLGYFLSRRAAQIVVETEPVWWAEDMYVGQALGPYLYNGGIKGYDIPDYECGVSWHWPRRATGRPYDPASGWMQRMYSEHK